MPARFVEWWSSKDGGHAMAALPAGKWLPAVHDREGSQEAREGGGGTRDRPLGVSGRPPRTDGIWCTINCSVQTRGQQPYPHHQLFCQPVAACFFCHTQPKQKGNAASLLCTHDALHYSILLCHQHIGSGRPGVQLLLNRVWQCVSAAICCLLWPADTGGRAGVWVVMAACVVRLQRPVAGHYNAQTVAQMAAMRGRSLGW